MSDATEALTPVQIATTVRETILELSSRPGVKPDVAAGLKSAAVGALACIEALKAQERALASPPNGAERDARWINVEERSIPEKGLVDLGSRRTGCYFDHICDEWRSVERGIMVVFKRKGITHTECLFRSLPLMLP